VVAWSKKHPDDRSLEGMLKGLQPEYLFLRDLEMRYRFEDPEWFREHYRVVEVFRVDPAVRDEILWIDRNIDTDFRIYKKNGSEDADYDDGLFPDIPD